MSLTLLMALAASVPFSGMCWLCAFSVDRLGAGVRLRVVVWTMALCLPVVLVVCALMVGAMDLRSPLADLRTHLQPAPVTLARHGFPSIPWIEIALATLAVGAAGRLGGFWIAGLKVARAVKQSLPVDGPLSLGMAPVRQTDCTTPVLAGFRSPVILMPRELMATLPTQQVALICAHEQSHLAAGDHIAHFLEEIAVRIFWFNLPLMAIRRRLTAAREEACDARVLTSCDDQTRRVYAQCLLAAFRFAGNDAAVMAFTGNGHAEAKRRLGAILHPRAGKAPARVLACATGFGLMAATAGLSIVLAAQPMPVVTTLTNAFAARLTGSVIPTKASVAASVRSLRVRHKPPGQMERADRLDPPKLSERLELAERAEQPERPEQPEQPEIPERPEQPERPDMAPT